MIIETDAQLCENSVKEDVFNILLNAKWTNNLKEVIYNKLLNAESSTAFINELTALDIDRNLHNAIVEAVSADGGF